MCIHVWNFYSHFIKYKIIKLFLLKLIEFLINFIQYNFLAIIIETDKQNFQNRLNIDLFMNIFSEDWSWE